MYGKMKSQRSIRYNKNEKPNRYDIPVLFIYK